MSFCVFGCVGVGGTDCHGRGAPVAMTGFFRDAVGRAVQEADPYTPFTDRIS